MSREAKGNGPAIGVPDPLPSGGDGLSARHLAEARSQVDAIEDSIVPRVTTVPPSSGWTLRTTYSEPLREIVPPSMGSLSAKRYSR
jgi:hypothetical protein